MAGKAVKMVKHPPVPKQPSVPKIFVLDTNVVLHDNRAVFNFQDNDVYIPVSVIEELDRFKKGNDTLSYNARFFVRELDKVSNDSLFDKGISLGREKGCIKIEMGHSYTEQVKASLMDDIPDHRIIATAIWLRDHNPSRKVILVTKDINMRLKAKALGLMAQDYLSDKVEEKRVVKTEKEVLTIRTASDAQIERIASLAEGVPLEELGLKRRPACNQYYRFISQNRNVTLARYDHRRRHIVRVLPQTAFGITPRNQEQTLALDAVLDPDIRLVALTGRSGTGKTLLALSGALAQRGLYKQIILSRPVIPLKNQDPDILPHMLPIFDNISVIRNGLPPQSPMIAELDSMLQEEKLAVSPLAYIRGRSLNNICFIVDEAQNLTPNEVKTLITRAGEGTKIIFTGDIYQVDQPYLDFYSNGLTHLCDKFFGQSVFAHINMVKGERSRLSELADKLL